MIEEQSTSQGGMDFKYADFLQWLNDNHNQKIVKVTKDHIQTSCILRATATHFFILETFGGVEIEWDARLGIIGNHKLNWKFANGTSQEKIIELVNADLLKFNDSF